MMSHFSDLNDLVFYIVRHGETDWNVDGRVQGQTDIALNPKGELQAKELAARLQGHMFTSCYSSDLQRAYQTAKIILHHNQLAIEITDDRRLRERYFGAWEGKLFVDYDEASHHEKLEVETNQAIVSRATECFQEIALKEKKGKILVLTHGAVIRDFLYDLLKLDRETVKISVKNTGFFKLRYAANSWVAEDFQHIDILEKASTNFLL